MPLSAQNTILDFLGTDLRPPQPEPQSARPINLLAAIKDARLSPKVTLDDNGNWVVRDIRVMPHGAGQLELPVEGPFLVQSCMRRSATK